MQLLLIQKQSHNASPRSQIARTRLPNMTDGSQIGNASSTGLTFSLAPVVSAHLLLVLLHPSLSKLMNPSEIIYVKHLSGLFHWSRLQILDLTRLAQIMKPASWANGWQKPLPGGTATL